MTVNKKYSIEVPLYSTPIGLLSRINRREDIAVVVYGGVPNSPLNGGRNNFTLDRLMLYDRFSFGLTKRQLAKALLKFYETVTKLNQNSISFRAAFTNMFVGTEELNDENLYPLEWLAESGRKYGVKNGVILNNKLLEDFIRRKYDDRLAYVASCTKYVSSQKILTLRETLGMYLEDCAGYDFVCLTPQDSRRAHLLKDAISGVKSKIIAISNAYCSYNCNSYYHYEHTSRENKRSLRAIGVTDIAILAGTCVFTWKWAAKCSAWHQLFRRLNVKDMIGMQLNAGIVNFKLGRGFGDTLIDRCVSYISDFEKNGRNNP